MQRKVLLHLVKNEKNICNEVNCETDFVAKNDDFINFVKELAKSINENDSNIEKLKIKK